MATTKHRIVDELAARDRDRMGAVKTTPPGPTITVGQAIEALVDQAPLSALNPPVKYGISPAEDMRKAFDEAATVADTRNAYQKVNDAQIAEQVNSPDHYNAGSLECIDAIAIALGPEGFRAFCHGNSIKYAWRARHKDGFVQDMNKSTWYSRMAVGDDPREDK